MWCLPSNGFQDRQSEITDLCEEELLDINPKILARIKIPNFYFYRRMQYISNGQLY